MNKKRINWWIIAAVLIIGIPVGFVVSGIIGKTMSKKSSEQIAVAEESNGYPEEVIPEDTELVIEEPLPVDRVRQPEMIEPVDEKPALTPEQIEEQKQQEELQRQRAVEQQLLAEQRKQERQEAERLKAEEIAKKKEADRQKALEEKERKDDEARLIAEQKEQERQRKIAEQQDAERQRAEAQRKAEEDKRLAEERKLQLAREKLFSDVKSVIPSGKSSPKVPEGCIIVVNGKHTTNYQDFRNGVKLGSYSEISVTQVEGGDIATRVYVNAVVNAAED